MFWNAWGSASAAPILYRVIQYGEFLEFFVLTDMSVCVSGIRNILWYYIFGEQKKTLSELFVRVLLCHNGFIIYEICL